MQADPAATAYIPTLPPATPMAPQGMVANTLDAQSAALLASLDQAIQKLERICKDLEQDIDNATLRTTFLETLEEVFATSTDRDARGSNSIPLFAHLEQILFTPDGQATVVLEELGWDIARLIAPSIRAPLEMNNETHRGPEPLLDVIAATCSPRELALFTVEYLAELEWQCDADGSATDNDDDENGDGDEYANRDEKPENTVKDVAQRAAVFIAFLSMWETAVRRLLVKRISSYVDTASKVLTRGMQFCAALRDDSELSDPSDHAQRHDLHNRLLNLYLTILETLQLKFNNAGPAVDALNGEPKKLSPSFMNLLMQFSAVCLGPLPLGEDGISSPDSDLVQRTMGILYRANIGFETLVSGDDFEGSEASTTGVGRAVLIAMALTMNNPTAPPPSANPAHLLAGCGSHIASLLNGPPHPEFGAKAFQILSRGLEPVQRDSISAGDITQKLDDLVQNMVLYLATTSNNTSRTACFTLFKELLARFDESNRARILLDLLLLNPDADPAPPVLAVQVAAMVILKDNVHGCWDKDGGSLFAGRPFTVTFLRILLDPTSRVYPADGNSSILPHSAQTTTTTTTDPNPFYDRIPLLMHVLNLYLYMLARDARGKTKNRTGLWDPAHLAQIHETLLGPLATGITRLQNELAADMRTAGDDTDAVLAIRSTSLALQMMDVVLTQIDEEHRRNAQLVLEL
ncbi:hypothetical protein DFJ77DRAFT_438963 [Powellomyces hirtus]|nr:hypothetical protein DFJ77DRAFT_438963 [Powellomyces hirtus]